MVTKHLDTVKYIRYILHFKIQKKQILSLWQKYLVFSRMFLFPRLILVLYVNLFSFFIRYTFFLKIYFVCEVFNINLNNLIVCFN